MRERKGHPSTDTVHEDSIPPTRSIHHRNRSAFVSVIFVGL